MNVTSKGQITIPLEIRQQFGFLPHSEVKFVVRNKQVILQKALRITKRNILKRQLESARGSAKLRMRTDEIMHLLRGDA